MKINNMTKYILFAFISFCSIIGIAFADDTIQIGQSRSIQKHCDLSGDSSLISDGYITIEHPNGGTNIKFNKEYPFNNQRIELKCTDGSVVSYTLNNTIFSGNNDNNENNFNKNNIISAYVGNGTCSFNGWKTVTYEGKTHYEYEATSPITLPSDCKMSDKEFGGWVSIPTGATGYITEQSGSNACQGANKNVTTSSGTFGACYKSNVNRVTIVVNGVGSVNLGSDWKKVYDGYEHTSTNSSDTVSLPSINVGFGMANDKEYVWKNVGTNEEVGPNQAVPHDGSTWVATFKYDEASGGDEVREKSIYVNDPPEALIPSGGKVSNCTSSGTYVTVKPLGGECQVTGIQATPEGTFEDVIIMLDSGKQVTYKFTVMSRFGEGQNGDEDFVIDTSNNIIVGENDETSRNDDIVSDSCDDFTVTHAGNSFSFAYDSKNEEMTSAVYKVKSACTSDKNTYVALCLDPGRKGPSGSPIWYTRAAEVKTTDDFGKMILYIARNVDASEFDKADSNERIAAHLAFRVVAILTGKAAAVDKSDLKYEAHYRAYEAVAKALAAGESAESAIEKMKFTANGGKVKELAAKFLSEYKNITISDNKLKKEVEESKYEKVGTNGYTLNYKGTLSIPTENEEGIRFDPCENPGLVGLSYCKVNSFTRNDSLSGEGKVVYDYDISITANNAIGVKVPQTKEEQKAASFKLYYKGDNTVDKIFLAEPLAAFSYQRMLIFNVSSNENTIYLYFDIAISDMCEDLPALSQSNCTSDDNCSSANFNKELYRAAGCCKRNLNEESYVYTNVCNANCTISTLATVCVYEPDEDTTETYIISEGKKKDKNNPEGKDAVGECVTNVTDNFTKDREVTKYEYTDDNDNPISDPNYKDNKYCRINCKEDWEIQMDSFGSFAGENAVAAGTYFTDGSSVFLSATRTCYTNFIDYDAFNKEEVELSQKVIREYNKYSQNSHIYSDMAEQQEESHDYSDINRNTRYSTTSIRNSDSNVCVQYFDCDQMTFHQSYLDDDYGFDGVSGTTCHYSKEVEYDKPVKCPEGVEGPCTEKATKTVRESGSLSCAFYGNSFNYSLRTSGKVETDEDYLYDEYNTSDRETNEAEGYSYDSQLKKSEKRKLDYHSSAKIDCSLSSGSGNSVGRYYCTMSGLDYSNSGIGYQSVTPACDEYIERTTTSPTGETVSLDSTLYDVCKSGSRVSPETYTEYKWTDSEGNKSAFELMSNFIKDKAESHNSAALGAMSSARSQIYKNDEFMFKCQHFQLFNTEDAAIDSCQVKITSEEGSYNENSLGQKREYVQLDAKFDPIVSYVYDEDGFMTILDDDNILVQYTAKNDNIYSKANAGDSSTSVEESKINDKINSKDKNDPLKETYKATCGIKVTLKDPNNNEFDVSRNYIETTYYNPDQKWKKDTDPWREYKDPTEKEEVKTITKTITLCTISSPGGPKHYAGWVSEKESAGGGYPIYSGPGIEDNWHGGSCYNVTIKFMQQHYIKQSMQNSSFYKTKGSWYLRASDIKEHGDDIGDALTNANKRSVTLNYSKGQGEFDYWALLGTGYNVFPVSLTTPRNLYQYTYYFGDIGSFNDGSLGRIMGTEKSIIKLNKRTCFYEVYEDLCLCCGDEINTHVDEDDYKLTTDFLNGGNYDYKQSDIGQIKINQDGTLSFSTSSVALGDMDSDSARKLGTNWSENSPYYFNGNNFSTDMGHKLKNIIESQGEAIYDDKNISSSKSGIEYRFKLEPETMQKIREYNDTHGYEINYKNLKVYGRYSIANINADGSLNSSSSSLNFSADPDILNNKVSTFQHLGSKFLESVLPTYGNGVVSDYTLSNRVSASNVCYIEASRLNSNASETIRNMINEGKCRWIDYIEDEKQNVDKNGDKVITRLSFK